jgi:hypothetical protein
MTQLRPIAGSKFFIGNKVAAKNPVALGDFSGQTWLEVVGWTQSGDIGDTTSAVSQDVIGDNRTRFAKGTVVGSAMQNTFIPDINDPGQIRMRAAVDSCREYAFKIEWGAGCTETGPVTISNGTPAVVTWAGGHGLTAGAPVVFATTGALPTGLTAGTTYYVVAAGITSTTFSVSATPGGAAINTTGAGSGTHTATSQPAGETDYFYGLAMAGVKSGGAANSPRLRSWTIQQTSNLVEV